MNRTVTVTQREIERERREFERFNYGGSVGGFAENIYNAIFKADIRNLIRVAQGFPAHVYVVLEYRGQLEDFIQFNIVDEIGA